MVFTVFFSGVLLLLLQQSTLDSVDGQTIDSNTLPHIITFFERYKRVDQNGIEAQHAVVINVPTVQCQAAFRPSQDNFLIHENAEVVIRDIVNAQDPVYLGTELIAAGLKNMGQYNIHSERLLFNPTDERPTTPMQKLLTKRTDDSCTILYTLNSPCADICLNEKNNYNILNGLKTWSEHSGIKALVFKQIWRVDAPERRKEHLKAALRKIVKYVPVYRCNQNECYACGGQNNGPIDEHCLTN